MEYVATRDGVEIIQSTESATKKQKQFIKKLLKDFPDAKELFEYSDYLQTPNRGTASAFIAVALDTHLHEVESESGYMSYIAQRPRAEKHGGHGLFSEVDTTDLKAAKAELDAHDGKVWTFIFSLRREDAERLGYNKAAAWRNLLKHESAAIAEAMRIQTDDFRWYAAYHDEGHHPHVHTIFGGFAPNSQTAEQLSKSLGSRTVLSGSVSKGKNDPSQSLQMIERPLMTPDELKSIPKGSFVVMKTGTHPMQTKLRLFLDWGITFGEPYATPEHAARPVAYASRQELFLSISKRYSSSDRPVQAQQASATQRRTPRSAMGLYSEDTRP